MHYFFRSWRDSLSLFMPQNAKLFSLITFKAIINTYKTVFKNLWWLLAAALISEIVYYRYFLKTLFTLIPLLLWFLFAYMVYVSVRPSLSKKDLTYYKGYLPYFIYFVVLCILAGLIPFYFTYISNIIADLALNIHPFFFFLYFPLMYFPLPFTFVMPEILPMYLLPLCSFWIFFLLDSRGCLPDLFKSFWRALKLVAYNYPFCIIAYALILGLGYILKLAISAFLGSTSIFLTVGESLFAVIPLCVYGMFYTKRLHEQFTLYYPESIKE